MAEVRFTNRALSDLESHLAWMRARNPVAADRLATDVEAALLLLSEHPLSSRALIGTSLRVALTRGHRFRLFHRVRGDRVSIVRVLHPRQSGPT